MKNPIYLHHKMHKFPDNQPKLKAHSSFLMILLEDYTYHSNKLNVTITVPAGSLMDGASIPRTLWRLMGSPFMPEFQAAAVIHDYLYEKGGKRKERKLADELFKELLIWNKVIKPKASAMYGSLRLFGAGPFNNK